MTDLRSPASAPPAASAPSAIALRAAIGLHKKGEYETVEALLRQALVEAPDDVSLWNVRGANLRMMKRHQQAIACFRKALSIAEDQPAVWSNLGMRSRI